MNPVFRGVWASVMATSSMTMAMFRAHQSLPANEQNPRPPAMLTRDIQKKSPLPAPRSSELQQQMTMVSHYGYGAAGGILYSLLSPKSQMNPVVKGSLFGLAMYAGSYYGLIPGLKLNPTGTQMTPKRNLMMIAAHVVWGASLGFAEQELRQRGKTLLDGRMQDRRPIH